MKYWSTDDELFAICRRELYSAVVGDIMDKLSLSRRFLPPQIQPLRADMVTIGRAMTVLELDIPPKGPTIDKPFGLMFDALDDLKQNEIYLCSGPSPDYALWGELMSARAMQCGAAGVVLNGYLRDARGILALNFPAFSYGSYAQDQATRAEVVDFRVPLQVGNVTVQSGDIVIGDCDGVCVVPQEAEEEVFAKAIEKARGEKTVLKAIQGGMSAREAFATFGIM